MSKQQSFSSHPGHGDASKTAKAFQAGFTSTKGGGAVDLEPARDNHGGAMKGAQVAFAKRPGVGTGQQVRDAHIDHPGFKHGAPRQ